MSTTTTTTTTTRDRGDRYGPIEWAQLKSCHSAVFMEGDAENAGTEHVVSENAELEMQEKT